jgi:hypothetical protein
VIVPSARVAVLTAPLLGLGCSCAARLSQPADLATWAEARDALATLREPDHGPRTRTIKLTLSAPYLPTDVSARGAVATRPGELRMVLLGPGGATAMDVWSSGGRYRLSIPATGKILTEETSETDRGLPVEFLRWWLLEPLGGTLSAARQETGGLAMLLRREDSFVDVRLESSGRLFATRTETATGARERVVADHLGCGRVEYYVESTRLSAVVECESERPGAKPEAFVRPCDAGERC